MDRLDYEFVDELPIRVTGGDRVWADMVELAHANRGRWIRRNFQYKSRAGAASVGRRLELRNPGIVAASRDRFVFLMFPEDTDA